MAPLYFIIHQPKKKKQRRKTSVGKDNAWFYYSRFINFKIWIG